MKDNAKTQGAFKGVNSLCRQCSKDCRQFENVKVISCKFSPIGSNK